MLLRVHRLPSQAYAHSQIKFKMIDGVLSQEELYLMGCMEDFHRRAAFERELLKAVCATEFYREMTSPSLLVSFDAGANQTDNMMMVIVEGLVGQTECTKHLRDDLARAIKKCVKDFFAEHITVEVLVYKVNPEVDSYVGADGLVVQD